MILYRPLLPIFIGVFLAVSLILTGVEHFGAGQFEQAVFLKEEAGRLCGRVADIKRGSGETAGLVISGPVFIYRVKRESEHKKDQSNAKDIAGSESNEWVELKHSLHKNCIVYIKKEEADAVRISDRISVKGTLKEPERATNPGGFDQRNYLYAKGIRYVFFGEDKSIETTERPGHSFRRMARSWKERIEQVYHAVLKEEQAGVLDAMILGEKEYLSDETKTLYQENGVAHLLVISGLHMSLISGRVYRMLRKRKLGYLIPCLAGILVLLFYGTMTGFDGSSMRAGVMFMVFLGSEYLGMEYDLLSSLSLAGILMILEHPYRVFDGGFIISFAFVMSIGTVIPMFYEGMTPNDKADRPYLIKCRDNVRDSTLLFITTLPVLLYFFYTCSLYTILINLILIPLMSVIMMSAVTGGLIGLVAMPLGKLILFPAYMLLIFFEKTLQFTNHLPGAVIIAGCPGLIFLIIYYAAEGGILCFYKRKDIGRIGLILGGLAILFLFHPPKPDRITILDVGQGDAALLQLDGYAILIDGGSSSEKKVGTYVLAPALKYYGVRKIDYVIMTHPDADHTNGITELLEQGYPIGKLIISEWQSRQEKNKKTKKESGNVFGQEIETSQILTLAADNQTIVETVGTGHQIILPKGRLICLHPEAAGEIEDANEASLVYLLEYTGFRGLFTGDLGVEREETVLQTMKHYGITGSLSYLKAGHHGSKNSTSEVFLNRLRPKVATISVGAKNRYGHPHQETLDRLQKAGTEIYRTDRDGAIIIEIKRHKWKVEKYK